MTITTTIQTSKLPAGLAAAIGPFTGATTITIEARASVTPSTDSQSRTCANAVVGDIDNLHGIVRRTGAWGGNNGFNKPPADRAWDPVFDDQPRDVPLGGAVVVGTYGGHARVYVHPTTFAERFLDGAARDAFLEGRPEELAVIRANEADLTDGMCAVLYAHVALKSGDARKSVVRAHAADLESCIARGLIKRASNGACTATAEGRALRDVWEKPGQAIAYAIRW